MPVYSYDNGDRGLVILDGAEFRNAIEVDTDVGYVVYYPLDDDGTVFLDMARGEIEVACEFGHVEFIPDK